MSLIIADILNGRHGLVVKLDWGMFIDEAGFTSGKLIRYNWVGLDDTFLGAVLKCRCTIRSDKDPEGIAWASTASSHAQPHLAGCSTDIAIGLMRFLRTG